MALLHMDGFDYASSVVDLKTVFGYGTQPNYASYMSVANSNRFLNNSGKHVTGSHSQFLNCSIENKTTVITGVAFKTNSESFGNFLYFYDSAGSEHLYVNATSSGISVVRGSTTLASAAVTLILTNYNYIAVKVVFNDSIGSVELYLNGDKIIDQGNLDTNNTANGGCSKVGLWFPVSTTYFDDWYIFDDTGSENNSVLPDARIIHLTPAADTAQKDFSPSTGTDNYAMVDEATADGDSTYVSRGSTGKDFYTLTDLPANVTSANAVLVVAHGKKTDTDVVVLDVGIKSATTESLTGDYYLNTSYQAYGSMFDTDPHTSGAWSVSAVNALQCGFSVTI